MSISLILTKGYETRIFIEQESVRNLEVLDVYQSRESGDDTHTKYPLKFEAYRTNKETVGGRRNSEGRSAKSTSLQYTIGTDGWFCRTSTYQQ